MPARRRAHHTHERSRASVNGQPTNGNVTWKYVGGTAIALIILGGSAWINNLDGRVAGTLVTLDATKERLADQATDQAVTKSKVEGIDRKVDEVQKDVNAIKSTLQQILINQQQQQREQQPRR